MTPSASETQTGGVTTTVTTTPPDEGTTTTPVPEIVSADTELVYIISYDGVEYFNMYDAADTAYLDRDKRKYLGNIYYNGKNYGALYYVYDYKDYGQPALVLGSGNGKYTLFLP